MDHWIELAQGPLFTLTFLIMILGLLRLFVLQVHALAIRKGRRLRNAPWTKILRDATTWILPVRHFIPGTVFFSSVSFLSHIGIILVPVFLDDHIVLWEALFNVNLPSIGREAADFLTLFTLVCIMVLFGYRTFGRRQRSMSSPMDYILLLMVFLPFASGYLASHPGGNPFPWNATFLFHILSAELLFVAIPFTKLAHIVLFMFDRISAVHWQLRPGAGDRVAHALFGNEAKV